MSYENLNPPPRYRIVYANDVRGGAYSWRDVTAIWEGLLQAGCPSALRVEQVPA